MAQTSAQRLGGVALQENADPPIAELERRFEYFASATLNGPADRAVLALSKETDADNMNQGYIIVLTDSKEITVQTVPERSWREQKVKLEKSQ